ncbi:MAG: hypothetical protein R3Y44_04545 [Rikenellaceae bacterium]
MKKLMMLAIAAIFSLSTSMAMAQPPQGQGEQREHPSTEERVKQLQEQLDLSDEQCAEIIEFEESREMPERGDRDAMKKMMEEQQAKMKEILTEEQYEKYEEMMKKQRPQQGGGGQRPQRN